MQTYVFLRKLGLFFGVIFLVTLTACGPQAEIQVKLKSPKTAGERVHEALVVAQSELTCSIERQRLLDSRKDEIVENIDNLLSTFPVQNPDQDLFNQRLKWLQSNHIEGALEAYGRLLKSKAQVLGNSINTLSSNTTFNFPSEEGIWRILQVLQSSDVKTLESRIRKQTADFSELPVILRRLANSEEGRSAVRDLIGESLAEIPGEEQVWSTLQMLQSSEVSALTKRLREIVREVSQPTSEDTREFFAYVATLKETLPDTGLLPILAEDRVWNLLQAAQREDVEELVQNITSKNGAEKVFNVMGMNMPVREYLRTKDGEALLAYLKRSISDAVARNFLFDFAKFAQSQRGWFEETGLSLCLGESWTSLQASRGLCLRYLSWWGGLDRERSAELLEHASKLYKAGLIDLGRSLESNFLSLSAEFENEIAFSKKLAAELNVSVELPTKDEIDAFLESDEGQAKALLIFETVFNHEAGGAFLGLAQLVYKHFPSAEIGLLRKLIIKETVTREQVRHFVSFINDKKRQEAARALLKIAQTREVADDLMRLVQLSDAFLTEQEANFQIVKKLAVDLGISLNMPSRDDVANFMTFATDKKNQDAAKNLSLATAELGIGVFQLQAHLASFPGEKVDFLSEETREQVYSTMERISKNDLHAFYQLLQISFDLWSVSPESQCQVQKTKIQPKNIGQTLDHLSDFLISKGGIKSWLSLFRRIANDNPAS